ncbi:Cytochrome c oxidase subunit 4 [Cladochytrium tenue]|nr:Cytochrome c oxidase subunit 4 [Cladochytrium tenue]
MSPLVAAAAIAAAKAAPRGVLVRAFSAAAIARSATPAHSKPADPVIPGYRKDGVVPKNWELATGPERYELERNLAGHKVAFEGMNPIYLTSKPTAKNPYVIHGTDVVKYIGCTGFPADTHEIVWLTLSEHKGVDRCPHCGNAFKYVAEHHH